MRTDAQSRAAPCPSRRPSGTGRPLAFALACALVSLLAAPAAANAAYTPTLGVGLANARGGVPTGVTVRVTQPPAGQSATRSFRVGFPAGFRRNRGSGVVACPQPSFEAGSCPAASLLGTARAQTLVAGLSGAVYLVETGGAPRVLAQLRGPAGLFDQDLVGRTSTRRDGTFDLAFDGLGNLPMPLLELRLDSGRERSLLVAPDRCGELRFPGSFLSHAGEQASSTARATLSGCPRVAGLRVRPRLFRAVRRRSQRRRRGYGTRIRWRVSEDTARTRIGIERRTRGIWVPLGFLRAPSAAGVNRKRFDGRLGGRALRRGRYRLTVTTVSARGLVSEPVRARFRVRRARR